MENAIRVGGGEGIERGSFFQIFIDLKVLV